MTQPDHTHLSPTQLAELSALADGSIDPARRPLVEAWVASSPEAQEVFRRERAAVELVRAVARRDGAPEQLRSAIARQRISTPPARRSPGLAYVLAAAVAAAALALALVLPAGAPGSPAVSQAAALALRGPAQPGPAPDPRNPRVKLDQAVDEVYFPNWSRTLGWRAIGQRRDQLDGHRAITVFYASAAGVIAYTILAPPVLAEPNAPATAVNGYELRTLAAGGRTIVTWRRSGHTCVISAQGVPLGDLERLASWRRPA